MNTLDMLKQIASCLAEQFGSSCEVVIHDLKQDLEHSIVHIENGFISNRSVGDGPSEIVLKALNQSDHSLEDRCGYLMHTTDGKVLRSSTSFIRNEKEEVEYVFSINFDISGMITAQNALQSLTGAMKTETKAASFPRNVGELLDQLIEQSEQLIGKPASLMNKDEKITAIQFLNESGAFLIKHSGDRISNYFRISKYTLYSYLSAATKDKNDRES